MDQTPGDGNIKSSGAGRLSQRDPGGTAARWDDTKRAHGTGNGGRSCFSGWRHTAVGPHDDGSSR